MSKPKTPKASKAAPEPSAGARATEMATTYRNSAGMSTTATTCAKCDGKGCVACGGFGFQTSYAKGLGL